MTNDLMTNDLMTNDLQTISHRCTAVAGIATDSIPSH